MKQNRLSNPVIPDYTPRKRVAQEEVTLVLKPCCVCNKTINGGYYGHWYDGGTCSESCEVVQEAKPKNYGYPNGELFKETS